MSLRVFALTCGHLTGDLGRLMEGGEGSIRLPIPAYLTEHPQGTALFDTGMHPNCQRDPAGRVGRRVAGLFAFDYHPGEEIGARLAALGRDPGKIDLIINFCRTLRERRLPRFVYDREGMLASLDRLAALEAGGARIFFGHDPEFWATVPQAPIALA